MYLGQSLTDVLEHLQHLHHVQVSVAVVVLSIVIIVVEFGIIQSVFFSLDSVRGL